MMMPGPRPVRLTSTDTALHRHTKCVMEQMMLITNVNNMFTIHLLSPLTRISTIYTLLCKYSWFGCVLNQHCNNYVHCKVHTVKLCYNVLVYNITSVIAYASSRSRHFSIQNVLVSMYLDITYPWILRTDF